MAKQNGEIKEHTDAADIAKGNRYRSVHMDGERGSIHVHVHTSPASVAVMPDKNNTLAGGHSSVVITEEAGKLKVLVSGKEVPSAQLSKDPSWERYLFDAANEAVNLGMTPTSANRIVQLANNVAEQSAPVVGVNAHMNLKPAQAGQKPKNPLDILR